MANEAVEKILEETSQSSISRCGFLLRARKDMLSEYLEVHQHVWPEMRQALTDAGWRSYSLFIDTETGTVYGYFEADDVDEAQKRMESSTINTRWQAEMAKYFVAPDGGTNYILPQYFYLQ